MHNQHISDEYQYVALNLAVLYASRHMLMYTTMKSDGLTLEILCIWNGLLYLKFVTLLSETYNKPLETDSVRPCLHTLTVWVKIQEALHHTYRSVLLFAWKSVSK